jgi:hypothetical protein
MHCLPSCFGILGMTNFLPFFWLWRYNAFFVGLFTYVANSNKADAVTAAAEASLVVLGISGVLKSQYGIKESSGKFLKYTSVTFCAKSKIEDFW